jgi:hypothetical protein
MNTQRRREPALHLLHGWWVASCPDCGYQFARRRHQDDAERAAARPNRRCPVCHPSRRRRPAAGPP